ncbi:MULTISPECIES: YecA family protein [Pseudoalteromonas]|uniref:YecA family protein n=1 Tax=Pseudoalteromonas TaxID=53246 RepID=UPI00057B2840|nr:MULTISPECIES: SEC-C domain-containing protein [Pseudoalteromonas]ATG57961.1 cytoplasmic protein [Pseudoalteromonas marina]
MGKGKIGRNDPCWCGSGKKYKKCHRDRESEKPVEPWDAAKSMRDKFSKRICSAPKSLHGECAKKIVKAHTVARSSSLKAIAVDGHVLGIKLGLESLQKHNGKIRPEKIGINSASTFTGFCAKHDDQLFSCLEKEVFTKSEEQCFKLAFRSFAREYYTKSALVDMYEVNADLDKGKPAYRQAEIQEQAFFTNIGAEAGLRDNIYQKERFDKGIERNDYSDIRAVVIEYTNPFPVQVSGSVNPDFGFDNTKLQDLSDLEVVPDLLSFTSFYDGHKSYIVLSWLEHCHNTCITLVKSLMSKSKEDISTYLAQYIFSNFENYFLSPTWWDGLSSDDKESIVEISHDNVNMFVEPHGNSISNKILNTLLPEPEKIEYVNWQR